MIQFPDGLFEKVGTSTEFKVPYTSLELPELPPELQPGDFVVIKTYQGDKYDRYLTDLFFLPGEPDAAKVAAAGRFLNQELLSAGLVKRYEE